MIDYLRLTSWANNYNWPTKKNNYLVTLGVVKALLTNTHLSSPSSCTMLNCKSSSKKYCTKHFTAPIGHALMDRESLEQTLNTMPSHP